MRLFARLMALLLVAALAGPFFLRGPDGGRLATWGDVRNWFGHAGREMRIWLSDTSRDVRSGVDSAQRKAGQLVGDDGVGRTAVYRWRDEGGGWHFSDEKPEGVASELIYVDGNANLFAAPEIRKSRDGREMQETPGSPTDSAEVPLPSPLSVPPASVPELIEDAYEARKLLEDRQVPE